MFVQLAKGAAPCAVPALCPPVRKVGYFGPVFPDGQGDRSNDCVPMHGTAQILTQSKNSDDELNKLDFPLKMPDCGLNLLLLPRGRSLPGGWVVFRVATGKLTYHWALCPRCADTGMDSVAQNGGGGVRKLGIMHLKIGRGRRE